MNRVLDDWAPDLSDNALRVLLVMARTALDSPNGKSQPAARYFGGWEPLSAVLTRPRAGSKDPGRSQHERIRKAVSELVDQGAVTRLVEHAHDGERQTYGLDALLRDRPERGNELLPLRGATNGCPSDGQRGNEPLPQEGQRTVASRGNEPLPPRKNTGTTIRKDSSKTLAGGLTAVEGQPAASDDDDNPRRQEPPTEQEALDEQAGETGQPAVDAQTPPPRSTTRNAKAAAAARAAVRAGRQR